MDHLNFGIFDYNYVLDWLCNGLIDDRILIFKLLDYFTLIQ